MAVKNFANVYSLGQDSTGLSQRVFVKEEASKGVIQAPAGVDFLYTLDGVDVNLTRPFESSPHRSDRHHTSVIEGKDTIEFTLPLFFNIDTTKVAAGTDEIDPALRALNKAMYGNEETAPNLLYDTSVIPSKTVTILENGMHEARQTYGAVVEGHKLTFPGDGRATQEYTGFAKGMLVVGVGKSTIDNNAGNTVTVQTGEGIRFPVGSLVTLVEADGATRSADTPTGTPRKVTSVSGDVVTVDGAVLADADGSAPSTPIYLCYYEPTEATIVAINDPQTGLVGSMTVTGLTNCFRSLTITNKNNHEPQSFCYGSRTLGSKLFAVAGRFSCEVEVEINLDLEMAGFINALQAKAGVAIGLVCGAATGRRLVLALPKVIFQLPQYTRPESGSIPVTLSGMAYQSALDAADEFTLEYK